MKPVFQKVVDSDKGDCMRACLASLLELDAEQIPNFTDAPEIPGMSAQQKLNYWLAHDPLVAEQGLALVKVPNQGHLEIWMLPPILCMFSMPSQKFPGGSHAVVGKIYTTEDYLLKFEVVHDPNPGNQPYPSDLEPSYIDFLIKRL